MKREQPTIGSFYKSPLYHPPSPPDGDALSYRNWLSRFRDKKDGWHWLERALRFWRKYTVEWLAHPHSLPEQYAFVSRLIATWADAELRIDSAPVRLVTEVVLRNYRHIAGGDEIADDPLLDLESDQVDIYLRDAIVTWERIYDASEAAYAPLPKLDRDGKRKAYARDHLWLRWKQDDKLGPAAIRDRWNGMDDFQREVECPSCPGEVKLETVKKGLKKAADEQKTGK